ncbi:MAG: hypothetical protein ABI972_04055 [Acidobacteriota bacterium]
MSALWRNSVSTWERSLSCALNGLLCLMLSGCQPARLKVEPSIEFTHLPPAGEGSPDKLVAIEGHVTGAQPGQRIVLFARSGVWWVQPTAREPYTAIRHDGHWKNDTHPGIAYAALLVTANFRPPTTISDLPNKSGDVLAVAIAEGKRLSRPVARSVSFSGYQWELRQTPSGRGGTRNAYDPANAWTDKSGFLHLRIDKQAKDWTSAEVTLTHSLGYGSYRFVVRDMSKLEPAVVFSVFTWDEAGPPREMNIEIGRWGETAVKNAQYVIQPYYVPANVVRFMAPAGVLTHSFRWEPGRVIFQTARGVGAGATPVASHTFSSGVPAPGSEAVHMNLYVYDNKSNPLRNSAEVVVEKFEYLP